MARSYTLLALLTLVAAACVAPRPVLYPNPKYAEAGEQTARRDVDECIELAEEFRASPTVQLPEGVTAEVLESATVGAATGGAVGAVVGNAGRGAGAGAAGGAARSLVRGIFRGPASGRLTPPFSCSSSAAWRTAATSSWAGPSHPAGASRRTRA